MHRNVARNCEAGCVCDDPPCPFGCEITWCKKCQQQDNKVYPRDCMCPSVYGIMAKPCEDLSHYIMEAKPDGCITMKEKMETEKYKEDQNVELVKMQSENTELVKIQLRYLSEQIKKETQKSTGKMQTTLKNRRVQVCGLHHRKDRCCS